MQGVGDIIRSEDTLFGEDGGDGEGTGLLEAGNDDMDVTIDVVEARVLNRTAGEGYLWDHEYVLNRLMHALGECVRSMS
jgi:hypothetical protein